MSETMELTRAQRFAKAFLMSMRQGVWTPDDYTQWKALTGSPLVRAETLQNMARLILEDRP